jgi:hypothetical protein
MMTSLLLRHAGFALLCAGVGLKVAATNPDYELKTKYRALLGVSVAACLFLLQVHTTPHHTTPHHTTPHHTTPHHTTPHHTTPHHTTPHPTTPHHTTPHHRPAVLTDQGVH